MFARVARDLDGVTGGGAHAGNFVSGHRGTDSGAVDHYPDIRETVRHRACDCVSKVRIVNGAFRVRAEVMDAMAEFGEKRFEFLLHCIAPMIGADCDRFLLLRTAAWNATNDLDPTVVNHIRRERG